MAKARFLYNNLITAASQITPSTTAAGTVGSVVPQNAGAATMHAQGSYTGDQDLKYTVQIDSVSAGAEVASATFRWKRSNSSGWEVTGVATSSSPIILDNGVQVFWSSGTGDDFVDGDLWELYATRRQGKAKLIDGNPNSEWRSTGVSDENLVIDLGSAQQVTAVTLIHHNLTAGATVTLEANSSDSWGAPAYSQALTRAVNHIGYFLDQNYRYLRLRLQDAANGDGYLRLAHLFVGTYLEPDGGNFLPDDQRAAAAAFAALRSGAGLTGGIIRGRAESMAIGYAFLNSTDKANFQVMHEALFSEDDLAVNPLIFCPDSDSPSDLIFGQMQPELAWQRINPAGSRWAARLAISEWPRTVAA